MNELEFSLKFLKTYRKGEIIFREGSAGQYMCVIQSGSVNICKRVQEEDIVFATLVTGEIFGEMALVDNLPRSATAVAAENDTSVLEIEHSHFVYLVGQQPAFALVVLKALSLRLRKQMEVNRASADGQNGIQP
jgi:CRP-like cAMP-binding protein